MRANGHDHNLVAHIDTGNSASTSMSAGVFDAFFPLAPGSKTERRGLTYLGPEHTRGVTGHTRTLQKYAGLRVAFDGVKSAKGGVDGSCLATWRSLGRMMGVCARGDPTHYDLLVSNRDMERLLQTHGQAFRAAPLLALVLPYMTLYYWWSLSAACMVPLLGREKPCWSTATPQSPASRPSRRENGFNNNHYMRT
jgi:hypothetical protein